jgi:hypothetical protein
MLISGELNDRLVGDHFLVLAFIEKVFLRALVLTLNYLGTLHLRCGVVIQSRGGDVLGEVVYGQPQTICPFGGRLSIGHS